MAKPQPKIITDKYEIMHRNTPSYASCEITWDTSKLTKITKNRVVKALESGTMKFRYGDAADMYNEVRKRFEIPQFTLTKPERKKGYTSNGIVNWEFGTDKLMLALDRVYKAERAIQRIESQYGLPWYLEAEDIASNGHKYFYYENDHDMKEVEEAMTEITNSPEIREKREQAIHFIESGGKLTFTWRA
jgi:hypothetical protein